MFFDQSKCPTEKKLANFSNYVRRQTIARFLAYTEIFKRQINIKGSIIECGVYNGGGIMNWAKLSSTLEPYNYHRKIIGFDTFEGFPELSEIDALNKHSKQGMFCEEHNVFEEMKEVIKEYDENRFINHIPKVELIKGDANITIPKYLEENKHLVVSLLFLDFDIYQPTITALEHLLPRIPKGGIIAFDEINNQDWPGETQALLEKINLNSYRLECFEFEPNISFIQL
jgi:hypothetical protein